MPSGLGVRDHEHSRLIVSDEPADDGKSGFPPEDLHSPADKLVAFKNGEAKISAHGIEGEDAFSFD